MKIGYINKMHPLKDFVRSQSIGFPLVLRRCRALNLNETAYSMRSAYRPTTSPTRTAPNDNSRAASSNSVFAQIDLNLPTFKT
jgi:hypothetical protein